MLARQWLRVVLPCICVFRISSLQTETNILQTELHLGNRTTSHAVQPVRVEVKAAEAAELRGIAHFASDVEAGVEEKAETEMASAATLPIVLAIGLACFVAGGKVGPYVPAMLLPYLICGIYITFSVAIDISIAVQKKSGIGGHKEGYAFNPVCLVLLTETVKFGISFIIYCFSLQDSGRSFIPDELKFSDTKWFVLPAVILTASNILVFQAIGKNDMSAFGVFRDTMVLWTAAAWRCVFSTELGWVRLAGVAVVFVGLIINKAFETAHSGAWSWMFMWVLAMTLCNAAGSVANEYALKHNRGLDINVQNMVLYSLCVICSMIFLAASDPGRYAGRFFDGFDSHTWLTIGLQAFVGLLVSRLLKYTDAVMKTIATCLRGPVVAMISPIFTHISSSVPSWVSAFVVATGCFTYLSQGPLNAAPKKSWTGG